VASGIRQRGFDVPTEAAMLVAAAIFLTVSRLHSHFSILATIRAPMLLSAASGVLLLFCVQRWRPADLLKHWIPISIASITAVAIIGIPFSLYRGRSLDFITDAYGRTLLLAIMAWAVARTTAGSRFIAQTLVLSGLAATGLAVLVGRVDSSGRLTGGYTYDANDLALIANVTLPLSIWWVLDRRLPGRGLIAAGIPLLFYTVVKSDSRGGFLGMAAVMVGFGVLAWLKVPRRLRRWSLAAVVCAVASFPLLPADYRERVWTMLDEEDYNMYSPRGRMAVWKRGIGYAMEHPLVGVGISNFQIAEGHISEMARNRAPGTGLKWSAAHNSFLQVTAELGFIAGAIFLIMILRTIYTLVVKASRAARATATGPPDLLPPLLGLSMIAFAVSGFFLSFAYYDLTYLLLALSAAVLMRYQVDPPRHRRHASRRVTPGPRQPPIPQGG
jgi:O-antigen ligase